VKRVKLVEMEDEGDEVLEEELEIVKGKAATKKGRARATEVEEKKEKKKDVKEVNDRKVQKRREIAAAVGSRKGWELKLEKLYTKYGYVPEKVVSAESKTELVDRLVDLVVLE
jgi:hypothetical protein